ncbi:MAG: hypothetical protein JXL97_02430 [Bacteroidales bacterium]|nr:hypothetical protein [Bacteroidales bacterium]
MKVIPLNLFQDEKLTDVLKREKLVNIPTNIVFDKTLTGIGATYTEIHAKRNSIIIEPNVPVIKGKISKHKELNLLGVYQGVTEKQIRKYLTNNSIRFKKLITTPEGFKKIRNAAKNIELNIYSEYFCLFDECERLNQDVGYRTKITNPVNDFFEFENKAFVSATPLDIQHPKIKEQNFYKMKIEPQFDYKKNIEVIITNDFANVLFEKFQALKSNRPVCIFYNSTTGIDSIVNSLRMQYNYKTFCSLKSKNILLKLGFKNVESDFSEPLAEYNFFTSRYFSAIDIELKIKPDIIILTDLNQAEHTIIDPFTEAIQIQGRFRTIFEDGKNYNSLTHITNIKGDLSVKTSEELDIEIEQHRINHEFLLSQFNEAKNPTAKKAVERDLRNSGYFELLDENWNLDEFAVHNKYNEERVRAYYKDFESLVQAYKNTGFFNVIFNAPELRFYLNEARFKIRNKEGIKKKLQRIVSLLKNNKNVEEFREMLIQENFADANLIVDAFLKLGEDYIISVDYSRAKMAKRLTEIEMEEKRFKTEILLEIGDTFNVGERKPKDYFKQELQKIYTRYAITHKVTQNTIIEYFEVSANNSLKPSTYTLVKFNCVAEA